MTKYLASIPPERNIELINAKVKIRLEHGNAIIMHPFVRQVKILSSTRMKETGSYISSSYKFSSWYQMQNVT